MIILLSPAKSLDFTTAPRTSDYTIPRFLGDAEELVAELKKLGEEELAALMKLSPSLAALNCERYAKWKLPFTPANSKQAILAFTGDVYKGLKGDLFSSGDDEYAQKHLRILSGLYGLLRPLDLIMPYRLEMGTKFPTKRGANLYHFWGESITNEINADLKKCKSDATINLASQEYFKAVDPEKLLGRVITPLFKERRGGELKVIALLAKKARGAMARYLIEKRAESIDEIFDFCEDGYRFTPSLSKDNEFVFVR